NPVLHEAIWGGHTQLVNDLVLAGSDLNWRDEYGSTPLHVAAFRGLDRVVSTLLLREEVFTNALDNGGATPLLDACRSGHLSVVNTLLAAGADVTIRNNYGFTALEIAVDKGHVDVIGALLRHGADVNACDDEGYTPLHSAAEHDQAGAIDALIQAGANIESSTSDLHGRRHAVATGKGLEATVDLLLRWGADETVVNNDGNTPADLLDDHDDGNNKTCSEAEIERVRLLLTRAPANRAWRRRCWLVMLRSCAKTARA
ncbi:unnamed protein product, partial [Ectocarpus fasciculatus]